MAASGVVMPVPELIKAATAGNVDGIRAVLAGGEDVDRQDKSGMTPLMHAAYKGKAEACRLLLARGANVNSDSHEHRYTPLMFAVMSGSLEVVRIILEAGANTGALNTINRTAAQMAGFIGHTTIANLINMFLPKSMLEYYTTPHGHETQPKLSTYLLPSLYELINTVNIHPVHILLQLKSNPELLHATEQLQRLFTDLVEKLFKETNEVLSMKLHLIHCVLQQASGCGPLKTASTDKQNVDGVIKFLLQGRAADGFPASMEQFLRLSVRSFPYHKGILFQQLVQAISPVEVGNDPTSLCMIHSTLLGMTRYDPGEFCTTCGSNGKNRRCTGCKQVQYCGQKCQQLHWFTHKKHCQAKAKAS